MPYIRMKVTVTGTASNIWDRHIPGDYYYEVDAFGTDDQRHKDAITQFHSDIHVRAPGDFDYSVAEAPYCDVDEDELHGSKTAAETLGGGYEDEPEEEPEPLFWYLNVYLTDRAYGGPEEGGWWYNYGIPATDLPDVAVCYGPYNNSEEDKYRLGVQREHIQSLLDKHNSERRSDVNSVLSEGRYIVCQEGHVARYWPRERPHYE